MIDGPPFPDNLARAYLDRLELEFAPGEVDLDALKQLQRAQLEHAVYETIDIVLGRPPAIGPIESARRILGGKGGYCYHLNGAFSALLAWLDVDVERHPAGVQRRSLAEPVGANRNHLGLTVRLADGSRWLVDVGLGDGPSEPLPLVAGVHAVRGFHYGLGPSTCGDALWRFEHDARGSFAGFDVDTRVAATIADFEPMHAILSTQSGFARTATAQRWVGESVEVLRGCVLTEIGPGGTRTTDVIDPDAWWTVVIDRFRLGYGDVPADERARLSAQLTAAHVVWDAAGRP